MMKLEEFAEINMGQSPVSSSYNENEDGLPFFQGKADFGKINPKAKVWCNKPTKIAEKDDILMSVRAPVGDLNIATAKCCIGRGLAGIRAKKDKCYFKYLFYFLRSKYNELNQMSTGSTFKAISKNNILNIEGNIPEIKEQKIIVSKLDKIQDLIIKTEEQIELLDDLIKSQFVEMFGSVKDSKWKKEKLEDITEKITDGKHGGCQSEYNSGYYFIGATEIYNDKINYENSNQITKKDFEKDYTRCDLKLDDFVIVNTGATIGKSAIVVDERCKNTLLQKSVALIRGKKEKILPIYLKYCYEEEPSLYSKGQGCARINLLLSQIRNTDIPVPPIELQNKFAYFVKQIDKQKFEIQNELIELKKVKEYLMNKYFN